MTVANDSTQPTIMADQQSSSLSDSQLERVPYMLVVGDNEAAEGSVSVRLRTEADLGRMPLADFIAMAHAAVDAKTGVEDD